MAKKSAEKPYLYVKKNWCKRCGFCVEFCPANVYEFGEDGYPEPVRLEDCTRCQLCLYICPDFAIIAEPEVKASVEER